MNVKPWLFRHNCSEPTCVESYVSIHWVYCHWYIIDAFREVNNQPVCAGLGCPTLDCDHTSVSLSRGHRRIWSIIKYCHVTARTNTQSHFLLSYPCLSIWFPSLHRKQGSASQAPPSPGIKSEKRCIPSCLRRKRSIKRVSWATETPLNHQQIPVTQFLTWDIITPPPMETDHPEYSNMDSWKMMCAILGACEDRLTRSNSQTIIALESLSRYVFTTVDLWTLVFLCISAVVLKSTVTTSLFPP